MITTLTSLAVALQTLTGTVYDSVARAPLGGAVVQIVHVAADGSLDTARMSVTADANGRFTTAVAPGEYVAAFVHPRLDAVGLEPAPRRVTVRAGREARIDLALPSPQSIVRALCGDGSRRDSTALVVGFLRDASTRAPIGDATVHLAWADFVLERGKMQREIEATTVRTRPDGWFGACRVPMDASVELHVVTGTDTLVVPVEMGASPFVQRDVYVGAKGARVALQGVVRTVTGRPIAGARVRIAGTGDTTVTGDDGRFALRSAPAGSRRVDVRALGYVPESRTIDLVGETPNDIDVALLNVRAFLDTVRVSGKRVYEGDLSGFERRRRAAGFGTFIGREMIDQRQPTSIIDLLIGAAGTFTKPAGADEVILMNSEFGRGACAPVVYVDGVQLLNAATGATTRWDLDWIRPDRVQGIEVYRSAANSPPQFTRPYVGCGTILVWTRQPPPKVDARPAK